MAFLCPIPLGCSSLSIELPGTLPWMANHTIDPRLCLTDETFLLKPFSLIIMAISLPLFMNTDLHNNIYLSSDQPACSDWPLAQYTLLGHQLYNIYIDIYMVNLEDIFFHKGVMTSDPSLSTFFLFAIEYYS